MSAVHPAGPLELDLDFDRRKRLSAMRNLATGLLAAMACLFVLAESRTGGHPAWGYLASFAEAAMVGALADWFAVVALFRHPMGLPIWHTAIIPNSKDEIAKNLGEFVETHFVTVNVIVTRIRDFDPASYAAAWLVRAENSTKVGETLSKALRAAVAKFDDTRLRDAVRDRVCSHLAAIEPVPILGKLADELYEEQRHHEALDLALGGSIAWLASDGSEATLIRMLVSVDNRAVKAFAPLIARQFRDGVLTMLKAALHEPDHSLRARYDGVVTDWLAQLKNDPAWAGRLHEFQLSMLEGQRLNSAVDALWSDLKKTLLDDLDRPEPRLSLGTAKVASEFGASLASNDKARKWINDSLCSAVLPLIEVNRGKVAKFIQTQIDEWSKKEMTERLELAVGRDLQFIRINGTIVGGLVGLALHALVQFMHGLS